MSPFNFVIARSAFFTALAFAALQVPAQAAPDVSPDVANAAAPRYDSAFEGYQAQQDAPKLPWQNLFNADGSFAQIAAAETVEVTVRKPTTSGHAGGHTAGRSVTLDTPTQLAQTTPAVAPSATPAAAPTAAAPSAPAASAAAASDTHGTIESINKAEGKVKLKHGPIPKFDMPGMTMVFRVRDPKLLEQVKAGDKVGVTMEMTGSAIVITGFQK